MSVANDLRAAAQYIREHGWKRRSFGIDGGPRCMVGAWWSATHDRLSPPHELLVVCDGDATTFNDRQCKTRNDAIAALEIAADLAS